MHQLASSTLNDIGYVANHSDPRDQNSYNDQIHMSERVIGKKQSYKFSNNHDHSFNSHLGHNVYKNLEQQKQDIKQKKEYK